MLALRLPVLTGLVLSVAGAALAQTSAQAALTHAEGIVFVNDRPVAEGTGSTLPDGAQIRTDAGRSMVSLKHGGVLILADHSSARVFANAGYNFNRIELLAGSAVVVSAQSTQLITCGTDVRLSSAGVFRFDVQAPEPIDGSARCGLRVYEGAGTTQGASLSYILRSGERMTLNRRAGDMIPVSAFATSELDGFDRWSRQQAGASTR